MKFTTETTATCFGIVFQDYVTTPYGRVVLKGKPTPFLKFNPWGEPDIVREVGIVDLQPSEALAFARHLNKRVKITTVYELLEDEPAEAPTP